MQNAGQFGQGAASAHPPTQFVPSEHSPGGGSTTSSLRQFRKKDVDKNQLDSSRQMVESHVARVVPHNNFSSMANDAYRFSSVHQFSGLNTQMKYSDHLAEASQPNPMSTSVIQKSKTKDYMEMCNMQQQQQQQQHLSNQQYSPDTGQYMQKEAVQQGYPSMYKESQFFAKEQHLQYQQMAHQAGSPKFGTMLNQNMRKYSPTPADNPFFNKLSKLHPSMARSIISDHHLQDAQPAYPPMDQRGLYPQQNHRFYSGSMHQPPYSPNASYAMNTPHAYPNYPAPSCNYSRQLQMGTDPRYPQMSRSLSPNSRRGYADAMPMHLNYPGMHSKMQAGPSYGQYRGPEYAQHYQHRRGPPQECYPPSCRPTQYLQNHHQNPGQDMQEMAGNTASPSDSLKKFIESWIVEEDPAGESSQLDANMNIREKLRDDAPAGTVYMINANDVHYFENNGIPIVTSDNGGFQLTSDNLCLVKGGLIDNSGVVRLIEGGKEIALDSSDNQERIVNLQIMEAPKSDCMVASKQPKTTEESRKVVIHQNTVLNPRPALQPDQNVPPPSLEDSLTITKELVDKNCSPINLEQLEENLGFSVPEGPSKDADNDQSDYSDDNPNKSPGSKSMPIIDFFGEAAISKAAGNNGEDEIKREVAEEGNSEAMEPDPDTAVKEETIEPVTDSACEAEVKTEPPSKETKEEDPEPRPEKRNRIFSVDDIMNNIGNNARRNSSDPNHLKLCQNFIDKEVEFSSLEQLQPIKSEVKPEVFMVDDEHSSSIVKVAGSSTVLQVAGELMEITVSMVEGKKIIKVKPLSSSTKIIDVNSNYEQPVETAGGDQSEICPSAAQEVQAPNEQSVGEVLEAPTGPVDEEETPVEPALEELMEETPSIPEEPTTEEPCLVENSTILAEAGSDSISEPQAFAADDNAAELAPRFDDNVDSDAARAPSSEPPQSSNELVDVPEQAGEVLLPLEDGEQPELVSCFEQFEEEPLHFALEDEVFIEEPPAHEVIVSDPLEGIGVIDEILLEPVTTTELDSAAAQAAKIEPDLAKSELDSKDTVTIKTAKLEVQILSPTSTNFEDVASHRPNVYCKGARKCSTDNDVSDYTVTTKAAKKLYDYDLQVQHDIVSSSKKEELPKSKKAAPKRSVRLTEKTQTKNEQKEALKQLVEKRKQREEVRAQETKQEAAHPADLQPERDEEYVDFKELLRARKLKKLKRMQETAGDGDQPIGRTPEPPPQEEEQSSKAEKPDLKEPQLSPPLSSDGKPVKLGEECSSSTVNLSKPLVLVPSISELMEENNSTVNKRKISLADYVNRKRKASNADLDQPKKPKLESTVDSEEAKPNSERTLRDMKTSFVIHSSDWEDSHSPQPAPVEVKEEPAMGDFNGLFPNAVIDLNELTPTKKREDRTLQEYKNKVESQLSSLNIQIPKAKPQTSSGRSLEFRSPHSSDLVKRFLNNEKLSEKEMEKIRKIISYKRSIQDRRHIRTPSGSATESSFDSSPCSTYEVKNSSRVETNPSEVRLHIKKVNSKRKVSFGQTRHDLSAQKDHKKAVGYSVINRLGQDGMPKIVFKRHKKSLAKEPVVELVKLNLNDLVSVQEEYNVTVSQNM